MTRVQGGAGFDNPPPPPLVGIDEEDSGTLPVVYDTGSSAGMLSEMFNFPPSAAATSTTPAELLAQQQQQVVSPYHHHHNRTARNDWYGNRQGTGILDSKNLNSSIVNAADSAAAMQLFLMNPTAAAQNTRSPSPVTATQGQFTWLSDHHHQANTSTNPHEIGGGLLVEGQGLSLSLSSSLEAAKAEELRMGDTGFLYSSPHHHHQQQHPQSHHYPYKTMSFQGGSGSSMTHPAAHIGFGSSSSSSPPLGVVHVLRNSKYARAAQELLEEFCSVGRGQFKKNKFMRQNSNPSNNINATVLASASVASSSSTKHPPPLSASDRIEHQRRKVKLLSMLDEACIFFPLYSTLSLSSSLL